MEVPCGSKKTVGVPPVLCTVHEEYLLPPRKYQLQVVMRVVEGVTAVDGGLGVFAAAKQAEAASGMSGQSAVTG